MPIQITSRSDGFRRSGMAHSAKTTTYPDDYFTASALAVLENEPQLIVVRVGSEAATGDDTAQQLSAALEKLKTSEKASVALVGERDALKKRVADLEDFIEAAKETINSVSVERDALRENNAALTSERDALQAQLAAADAAKQAAKK
ncbi:HI1506-related protein [Pectobacterium brasiliense]|uniref:HI1506-related protein n=1 Tax=Pectobacterium brasiliense TaxID=180957 RepID=UPI004043E3AD